MADILGFSTYPVKYPVHGGQRRVAAFRDFYRRSGLKYEVVCIFEKASYSLDKVGSYDLPLDYVDGTLRDTPFIGDLLSGLFGAKDDGVLKHFTDVIKAENPRALVLEQPFMWPLIKRLRCDPEIEKIPLIYSSQNWEAPLKYAMLVRTGTTPSIARTVEQMIEDIEREAVHASQLIFAVSDADANIYREIDPGKRIIVVRNGDDRPGQTSEAAQAEDTLGGLRDRRYLFFVGSAYPPNVDGMCDLLLEDGLFFMPPRRGLAICGGSAQGIFDDPRYQRFLGANTERVSLYPSISDANLETLKSSAHAILLPINFGGGSNLKTAEALASGKWVVATPTAMRGFENYISEPGVVIAEGRAAFRKAVITVFNSPPLQLTDAERARRDMVYWDHCFDHVTLQDLNLNKPASIAPIG